MRNIGLVTSGPDELVDYFARRRGDAAWRGCNITIPHKVSALAFVDECDSSVAEVGAANCIVSHGGKLVAHNTDISGVDAALLPGRKSVCLIGAGGAARSAIPSLKAMSAFDIRVLARDVDKAKAALADFHDVFTFFGFDHAIDAMQGAQGVINASPLGMAGQTPMPQAVLEAVSLTNPNAYVFDMVYAPLETELLRMARLHGRDAIDGLEMLVGQAGGAFSQFFGQHPDPSRQHDAELHALLTA